MWERIPDFFENNLCYATVKGFFVLLHLLVSFSCYKSFVCLARVFLKFAIKLEAILKRVVKNLRCQSEKVVDKRERLVPVISWGEAA